MYISKKLFLKILDSKLMNNEDREKMKKRRDRNNELTKELKMKKREPRPRTEDRSQHLGGM